MLDDKYIRCDDTVTLPIAVSALSSIKHWKNVRMWYSMNWYGILWAYDYLNSNSTAFRKLLSLQILCFDASVPFCMPLV